MAWDLRPLLAPRSIAVVGASESSDSWAPEIERSLRHLGYDGELYPDQSQVRRGLGASMSVLDRRVAARGRSRGVRRARARRRADDRRVRRARGAGDHGRVERVRRGRRGGSRAPGRAARRGAAGEDPCARAPTSRASSTMLTMSRRTARRRRRSRCPAAISVISQSGTVAWTMNQMASDRGVGLRIILGVGNEAVLGLGDLFAWAATDPKTKVVTSYIETMRDVEGIGRGLDALRAARKPVLICAPEGRSEAALRSIIAHTGALAGNTGLARRVAPRPWRGARRGPRHVVRGGRAAVAHEASAHRRRRRRAAVGRRLHVVRRGRGRGRAAAPGVHRADEARAP